MLSDVTPAWREAYVRIADELLGRYTTFWAAADWLTQIGHDPRADNYPPEWMAYISEHLRGRYDGLGWCANGVEPWGLQPDPIGADGILSFRGFLNLLLSVYRYVGGDDKWEKPFRVTGYQDRRFDWDHTPSPASSTTSGRASPPGSIARTPRSGPSAWPVPGSGCSCTTESKAPPPTTSSASGRPTPASTT
jgi:hypothetical protein